MASVALAFRLTVDKEDELSGFMLTHATVEGVEENAGETIYYIPPEEWTPDFQQRLGRFAEAQHMRFLGAETIEQRDWNAEWEATLKPERITGDLIITPSWHAGEARASGANYVITIDPKMSFGTGHHETTRLCLRALERIDITDKRVLDLGTGTGVLAIYALLRRASFALGVDTDEWSIGNALENRALNDITPEQLEIRRGTLATAVAASERFDLILANIHRNVLVDIAADVLTHMSDSGYLILSGLLVYDAEEVRAAYERVGLVFVDQTQENEWISLVFRS